MLWFGIPGGVGILFLGTEYIPFWWSRNRTYKFLVLGGPGTRNLDSWCSRYRKYNFLVVQGWRILIFCDQGSKIWKIQFFDGLGVQNMVKLERKDLRGAVADCTEASKPELFDSYVIYA